MLRGLTSALNSLATFAANHPTLTQGLMLTFAGLSSLATLGGTLMVAGAGLKVIGLGLSTFTGLPLLAAATGLGTLTAAVAGIVALGMAVGNADSIGGSKYNPLNWIQDGAFNATRWMMGKGVPDYGHPTRENAREIRTVINLDGRKLAEAVNKMNADDMRRSSSTGGRADYRALPRLPGDELGGW
jgi:hypothetical protein